MRVTSACVRLVLALAASSHCVLVAVPATLPRSSPAGMINMTLPLAYMQSAFTTGHASGVPCRTHGNINPTLPRAERLALLRQYASNATSFRGGEIFFNTLETPAALLDVREMNQLILSVAAETHTEPFHGFWIPARLPGMWWPSNYTRQPVGYRARALMSNGSAWALYPTEINPGTSILNLQGSDLDITNPVAVGEAMTNLRAVMRTNCTPLSACVGPLVGSYLFSEAALTATYEPFATFPYQRTGNTQVGNISDLQPALPDGRPPLLRMGNATELYTDDKVVFSFYQGPKRTVPLFSLTARDSFVRYCAGRGVENVATLPADRGEFNDDDATVRLPPHVSFVAPQSPVWKVWEDWVMQTWFDYCERLVLTVNAAQAGNPYFGGAFMFQLAGWYAVRSRSERPVSYSYRDLGGTLRRQENETVADWAHYADLNPVVKGIDLEMWAAAPWLSGFIHEASHGVPHIGVHPPMATPPDLRDRFILASDRHRHFVNAQGQLAKDVMAAAGKLFGSFARAAYISDPTWKGPSVADTLSVEGFEQAWNYSTSLLRPSIVSTLGSSRFTPGSPPGRLHDVFERLFRELWPRAKSAAT